MEYSLLRTFCIGAIASILMIGTVSAAAPTSTAKPGRVMTTMVKSGAIVEAVNKETREVKLIDPQGNRFTVVADELVRNFDQIEPRDRVVVEYLESVALVVAPEGSEPPIENADLLEVAAAGDKPGVTGVTIRLSLAVTNLQTEPIPCTFGVRSH
jgi:hypothetical protein